jgi:hypothetical protein
MSRLSEFFKETHTALDIFYPLHCLVAAFPNFDAAQQVAGKLRQAGFAEDEVIAVEGREFIELENKETGLGSLLMREFSRGLGAEQVSTDHNLDFASTGAGFVFVHCPAEKTKQEAWGVMQPSAPLAAHYYSRGSVDHLAGGFSTD